MPKRLQNEEPIGTAYAHILPMRTLAEQLCEACTIEQLSQCVPICWRTMGGTSYWPGESDLAFDRKYGRLGMIADRAIDAPGGTEELAPMQALIALESGGTKSIPVYCVEGGLAVEHDTRGKKDEQRYRWGVLHLASGMLVAGPWTTHSKARACQQALLALPVDWTHPATDDWLRANEALVWPVVRDHRP